MVVWLQCGCTGDQSVTIWTRLRRSAEPAPPRRQAGEAARYAAFISYSHAADGQLAPAVQRGLQRLAKPWHRRHALRIFRDGSGLAVTPALWSSIADALDRSDHFVLLASPDAAKSQWVDREIERWKATKPIQDLLLVLTDGELHWDSRRGDFDLDRSTALPAALFGVYSEEPGYLDLRWARTETELHLRHSRFRHAIAQLAAPLHGREMDDLESEDIRLQRRALRTARSAVAVLIVLLLGVSVTGVMAAVNARRADQQARAASEQAQRADQQARTAEQQAQRADEEGRIARARKLAALASARLNEHPLSLLLGLESLRTAPTNEAFTALLQALQTPQFSNVLSLRHSESVDAVAFSPDGTTLVTAAGDETARRWEVATGRQISQTPIGPPRAYRRGLSDSIMSVYSLPVVKAALSRDGNRIVTIDLAGNMRLQDTATGQSIGPSMTVAATVPLVLGFSPNGSTIVTANYENYEQRVLSLWDGQTGRHVGRPLAGHTTSPTGLIGLVNEVAFNHDGTIIASAGVDGTVRLWNASTGQAIGQPLRGHTGSITAVTFSPDGKTVATGGDDHTIRLWDTRSRRSVGRPLSGNIQSVARLALSPDGKTLASAGADRTLTLWDVVTGQQIGKIMTGDTHSITHLAFSPDGMTIVAVIDRMVKLWSVRLPPSIGKPLAGEAIADAVAFSSDGKVITAEDNRTIRRWDASSGEPIGQPLTGPTGYASVVAFSPDATMIASAGSDQLIRLRDTHTGQPIGQPLTHTATVSTVAFSPDGKTIASAGWDNKIRLWNVTSGQPIGQPLTGHIGSIENMVFSPDGKMIVSAGYTEIRLWNTTTGLPIQAPLTDVGPAVSISPDGQIIAASGQDGTIRLFSADTGQPIRQLLNGHTDTVRTIAFSPDGTMIASAGEDQAIQLWDTQTGEPVGPPLTGHTSWIDRIVFSPDGKMIASVSNDNTVRRWPVTMGAWVQHACSVASRNMQKAEWDDFVGSNIPYVRTCPGLPSGYGAPPSSPAAAYQTIK